jgi:hypothetical protein
MLDFQSIHEIFRKVKGVKNNMKNEDIECKTEYYIVDIFLRCGWPVKIYGLTEVLIR